MNGIVYVLIALIILIAGAWVASLVLKRKHFTELELLESRKIDLMSKPVFEEISRIKQLTLDGETQASFAKWRQDWDKIITVAFPEVEIMIFDAEEAIGKFRFNKGKDIGGRITSKLDAIEASIQAIFRDIEKLMKIASKNEEKCIALKERCKELKKHIMVYNHALHKSVSTLEREIDECFSYFDQIDDKILCGDYFSASQLLTLIEKKHQELMDKTIIIPNLYKVCREEIPAELLQMKKAYEEMSKEGYILKKLNFDKKYQLFEKEVEKCIELLDHAKAFEAKQIADEINEQIDKICEKLSLEREAKQYVDQIHEALNKGLNNLAYQIDKISAETVRVLLTYHVSDEDLLLKGKLENNIEELKAKWTEVRQQYIDKQAPYSIIKDQVTEIKAALTDYQKDLEIYSGKLGSLCTEESAAREKLQQIQVLVRDIIYHINQANLLAIPDEFTILLDEAKAVIEVVDSKLQKRPLNMKEVLIHLNDATEKVDSLKLTTDKIIETSMLAEKVIQYGNRYRLKYPEILIALTEAEELFRSYQYADALELASIAIEKVEPGFFRNLNLDIPSLQPFEVADADLVAAKAKPADAKLDKHSVEQEAGNENTEQLLPEDQKDMETVK